MTALYTTVSLLMLWGLYWAFRKLATDAVRQSLFEVRDDLFDLANSGEIPFTDPAYGLLRSMLNAHIRYAHRMTIASFVLHGVRFSTQEKEYLAAHGFDAAHQRSLARIDAPTRAKLQHIRNRMHNLVILHLAGSSLCMILFLTALSLGALLKGGFTRLEKAIRVRTGRIFDVDFMDSMAASPGAAALRPNGS